MTVLTEKEFSQMIEDVSSIDEVAELRDILEGDEYEVENRLEMSSRVSFKESIYGL